MLAKFSYKQKILLLLLSIIVISALLFTFLIKPIFVKNKFLQTQLASQEDTYQYLTSIQNELLNNKIFPSIDDNLAKSIIAKNFKNITKSILIKNQQLTLTAASQNFDKIIQNINNLKNNYGIIVSFAKITKVKNGLVDIQLIFKHP